MKFRLYNLMVLCILVLASVSWYILTDFEEEQDIIGHYQPGKGSMSGMALTSPFFLLNIITALLILARKNATVKIIQEIASVLLVSAVIINTTLVMILIYITMIGIENGTYHLTGFIKSQPIRYLHYVPCFYYVVLFVLSCFSKPPIKPANIAA